MSEDETDKKPRVGIIGGGLNAGLLTAALLNHLNRAGVEVVNPDDDIELGLACDEVGKREAAKELGFLHVVDHISTINIKQFNDPYDVELDCRSDSTGKKERPDWKSYQHKKSHKANARKSAKRSKRK